MLKPLLLTIFLSVHCLAEGKIYKWKDENGNIHYSENKPENKISSEITVRTSNPTSAPLNNKPEDELDRKKATTDKLQQFAEQDQHRRNKEKERRSRCRNAKNSMKKLKGSFAPGVKNKRTGSYTYPNIRNETRIKANQQELIRKKQIKINDACKRR